MQRGAAARLFGGAPLDFPPFIQEGPRKSDAATLHCGSTLGGFLRGAEAPLSYRRYRDGGGKAR